MPKCAAIASAASVSSPGHHGRILLAVAIRDRRGVLVPVGELRPFLREHHLQPLLIQSQDIADMAGILEGRPFLR